MSINQRRSFLKHASVLGAAGLTTPWALNLASMGAASAQSSSATDYKALVCIFLAGGNDAHNTVVPNDEASWYYYSVARDPNAAQAANGEAPTEATTTSIALKRSDLLPITVKDAGGFNADRNFKVFALHPQLKRIRDMYANGKAAVIANVGPLIVPTNKIDLYDLSFPLPANLRSHNDQQSMWQSFGGEGASTGWGGLMMDSLMSRNAVSTFSSIGINGGQVWLAGKNVMPFQLSTSGLNQMAGAGSTFGSPALYEAVRKIASTPTRPDTLALDYTKTVKRALSVESTLLNALSPAMQAPWGTPGAATSATDPLLKYTDPNTGLSTLNPLALQLQVVARMIAARDASGIGAKRQVFMVTLGGFDTHSDLLKSHGELMAKLDHGVAYFYDTLAKMPGGQNLSSNVTSFTASDFGRALNNNGDGTDHGWGGHHFVFGGSVKGGDMYGRFPDFSPFDQGSYFSANLLTNGVLLPTQSVDQLVYTLGKWMDVPESALTGSGGTAGIAPNIGNFNVSTRNLGFMA